MSGGEFEADLAAATDDLEALVRRLRSLSTLAWEPRADPVRTVLAELVVLASQLENRELNAPEVANHVLADAIAVVGGDVLAHIATRRAVGVLAAFRATLVVALAQTK